MLDVNTHNHNMVDYYSSRWLELEPNIQSRMLHLKHLMITMPLYIRLAKYKVDGKKYWINLNNFNTWKWHGYNDIKVKYIEEMMRLNPHLDGIKMQYIVSIDVQLVYGSRAKRDRENYTTAFRKFMMDWLVKNNIIADDDERHVGDYRESASYYLKDVYNAHATILYY